MLQPPVPGASCRQFSFSDIKSATNDFSSDLIIGNGAFGNVYKATIATGHESTSTVAVKRRKSDSKQGPQEFSTEISLLSAFRHTNLISLIGYCVDEDTSEMILVYEYMANGTLADHIYKKNENSTHLSWEQRLKICIGVGLGLEYLHTGTGSNQTVLHRDLKSSNILLDADFSAKISDFGLCKITRSSNRPYNPIIASLKGTFAYMDPNYRKTRELSTKSDVYALGVVLLEVLCGRRSLDFEVADREKRLVLWAQQCIREGVAHRIIDPGLWGEIADDGLRIFLDIALKCLHDRPDRRPTVVEVVAKLHDVLASQYTAYSSPVDDEFVKIHFEHVSDSSSSTNSDVDSFRSTIGSSSGSGSSESDIVKQDHSSETNTTPVDTRFMKSKLSSRNNVLVAPVDLQSDKVKADVSISLSHDKSNEYEKLVRRMNPPRVAVDNESCENATVIKVDYTNKHGVLLEVVQILTDFDLRITKASRTSDGGWAMDVFNVIDQEGNKVMDKAKIQNIQEALCSISTLPTGNNRLKTTNRNNHTTLELIGNDRPGLLSEISAILTNFQCNVLSAELWTHNTRIAGVIHVTDDETKSAIIEPEKLSIITKSLSIILKGGNTNREATITVAGECARFDRRLHEMMFADRDYERGVLNLNEEKIIPKVDVVNWNDKDYSEVSILCKNTPKVLFDIICTLTHHLYVVFHGNFDAEGPQASMEFWIKHIDGSRVLSDAERQRVIQHLKAAIQRRVSEGLKIEIRTKDRVGLLSDVTRIIRESSLTITRAQVTTTGDKSVFAFYLDDNMGYLVDPKIIDYVKKEIGQLVNHGKGIHEYSYQVPQKSVTKSTFKEYIKAFVGCIKSVTYFNT